MIKHRILIQHSDEDCEVVIEISRNSFQIFNLNEEFNIKGKTYTVKKVERYNDIVIDYYLDIKKEEK